ncbi:unnamed protein product [Angiostrongylus costaricensis]|uniref:Microtubule-associated protein n=1 Tax=Angiostrongylus costaricensis TaxID=334426 RepID=A0A0R3Q0P3_ANGCS|nr:unnamed protein product [Angiostrongylus costaricensis]
MPKPETPLPGVRTIRPPAPRSFAKAAERELVSKKPTSRTQSQPRPSAESKSDHQSMRTKETKSYWAHDSESIPNKNLTEQLVRIILCNSSKIGSFTSHKPQGGNVQIFSENRTYNVQSKIGSLNNVSHTPGGGNVRIPNMKLDFKEKATPRVDAKSDYVPSIPEKKAISQKLNWAARSKIGSLDNVKHKPAGGNVQYCFVVAVLNSFSAARLQILDQKLQWHATSKVGSRDNIGHKPGGGNVQVICDCD